jgi:predicted aspartyl protease
MLIPGEWYYCDDGETRPIFRGQFQAVDGSWIPVELLADTGADHTTLTTLVWSALGLQPVRSTPGVTGLGGLSTAEVVETTLRLVDISRQPIVISGEFLALTDPSALDMCVLGRDLTDKFTLLVDRLNNRVCLLGQRHSYRIVETA